MTGDFDYEAHERLRSRVANCMDSVLWTYKQNFKAASVYGMLDLGLDAVSTLFAGLLTYSLVWEAWSTSTMTALAIGIAVISGFKTAARPQKRSSNHYKAANTYHTLFEEFRDYVVLDLADKSTGLEKMRTRFEELSERRIELNKETPDVSSFWYRWLSLSNRVWNKSIYDEIGTSEQARKRLTSDAKLIDSETPKQANESGKDRLTGEANLEPDTEEET